MSFRIFNFGPVYAVWSFVISIFYPGVQLSDSISDNFKAICTNCTCTEYQLHAAAITPVAFSARLSIFFRQCYTNSLTASGKRHRWSKQEEICGKSDGTPWSPHFLPTTSPRWTQNCDGVHYLARDLPLKYQIRRSFRRVTLSDGSRPDWSMDNAPAVTSPVVDFD